jgi:hypothetical protein
VRRGYRRVFADLFRLLPPTTDLVILVHPSVDAVLRSLLDGAGRSATIVPVDEDLHFGIWAQDPSVVLEDARGRVTLLAPTNFDRGDDAATTEVVARAIGARVQQTTVNFHGGDVLTTDDLVLLGRTSRGLGPELLGSPVLVIGPEGELPGPRVRPLRARGRDLVEVLPGGGPSPHPLIHLDMFLTPAGRGPSGQYRLLVGSTSLADRILGRAPVDPVLDRHLDSIAEQAQATGFRVLRNPLPLTYGDGRRGIDGDIRDVRLWYLATANNCLVQIDRQRGNHVWLPTYGHGAWQELAATDAVNRRLWQDLGFTVHGLADAHTLAHRFGALHCMAKDLGRVSPATNGTRVNQATDTSVPQPVGS